MTDLKPIAGLSENKDLIAFYDFILSNRDEDGALRLDTIDLMKIARLMNRVFIIDVKPDGDKKLLFRYTGSSLDQEYDATLTGRYFEDAYQGSDRRLIIGNLCDALETGHMAYIRQHIILKASYEKLRLVERLAFPASSDGNAIDRLIGIVTFSKGTADGPNVSELIPLSMP